MGYSIQLELEQIFPVPFQLWVLSNHWFDLFFVEELDQVMVLESLMLSWNHRASKAISMAAYFAIPIDLPSSSLLVKDPFGYSDVVDNIMVVVTKVISNIFRLKYQCSRSLLFGFSLINASINIGFIWFTGGIGVIANSLLDMGPIKNASFSSLLYVHNFSMKF